MRKIKRFEHVRSKLAIWGHFTVEEIEIIKSKGYKEISNELQLNKHGIPVEY